METSLSDFIDISTFENTLFEEAKITFIKMIEEYKSEKIYMMGFYHSGSYSYVFPIALTEADLEDDSEMRWFECDAEHHGEYEGGVEDADALLSSFWDELCYQEAPDKIHHEYRTFIEKAVANVFTRLENDGVFDDIGDRGSYVINLVCGDQGWDDKLKYAERVNPKAALTTLSQDVERRQKEIEAALESYRKDRGW